MLQEANDQDPGASEEQVHLSWYDTSAITQKLLYSLRWAVKHYHFQYFVRISDESYFRPDEFYRQTRSGELPSKLAVIGNFIGPLHYEVAGKTNEMVYPASCGYIITFDIAAYIAASASIMNVGFPEDAHFGAWVANTKADYINITDRIHDFSSDLDDRSRVCSPRDVLTCPMSAKLDGSRLSLRAK